VRGNDEFLAYFSHSPLRFHLIPIRKFRQPTRQIHIKHLARIGTKINFSFDGFGFDGDAQHGHKLARSSAVYCAHHHAHAHVNCVAFAALLDAFDNAVGKCLLASIQRARVWGRHQIARASCENRQRKYRFSGCRFFRLSLDAWRESALTSRQIFHAGCVSFLPAAVRLAHDQFRC